MTREELLKIIKKAEKQKLTALYLSDKKIEELPSEIGSLVNLQRLDLGRNQLKILPQEIGNLKNLQQLNLHENLLTRLPQELWNLTNLQRLSLHGNQLMRISYEIKQLKNLRQLSLHGNQLTTLPPEVRELISLQQLDVGNNQLAIPPEILQQSPAEIINYIIRNQSKEGKKVLNESKMLIVGQGEVGKTSLKRRLIKNEFEEKEKSTEGISIDKWVFSSAGEPPETMTLNVWDFGGQEIYHATHQFFLTQRSLYLFVWDARAEEEYARIDYWLNTIESFAEDSPIMIVLNKADVRTKELNMKDFKERFPQIVGWYKVSCKNGAGIKDLTAVIQQTSWKLPLVHTQWFEPWVEVREILEMDTRNQMSHSEYLAICEQNGLSEIDASSLSKYLHDLGVILHFHDDILLKDTIILKPEWGTDAVYKVLDAALVKERHGILRDEDLPVIWNDRKKYPSDRYATLLRLMVNFEIAFPLGNAKQYIVAELLPNEEIPYTWSTFGWNIGEKIRFEYQYEFLPSGIMTRCIIRLHNLLIEKEGKKLCWKEGAFFAFKETRAFVKIFPLQKKVEIQVEGRDPMGLLAILRKEFVEIHRTIKKLNVKERIPCNCEPHCTYLYDYDFLLRLEERGKTEVTCQKSIIDVNVASLLNGVESKESRKRNFEERDKI